MNVTLPSDTRVISNTEVDTFLRCQRKHYYQFLLERVPKSMGRSLTTGIIGHEVLAEYYNGIRMGLPKDEAFIQAMKILTQYIGNTDIAIISKVQILVSRYVEQDTIPDTCEILAVEEDYYIPFENMPFAYGMRLDLMVKSNVGASAGTIRLIDHKFVYDFYSQDDIALGGQIPKYIGTLRYNGLPVHSGAINQFRTRFEAHLVPKKLDTDLFRRDPSPVTPQRIRSALTQQIQTAERIIERRNMTPQLQESEATPVLNKMTCKSCPFTAVCIAEQNGEDVSLMLKQDYVSSTYGYNKVAED